MNIKEVKTIGDVILYYENTNRHIHFHNYSRDITVDEILVRLLYFKQATYFKNGKLQCGWDKYRSIDDFIIACKSMLSDDKKLPIEGYVKKFFDLAESNIRYSRLGYIAIVELFKTQPDYNNECDWMLRSANSSTQSYYYIGCVSIRYCPDIRKLNTGGVNIYSTNEDNYVMQASWTLPSAKRKRLALLNKFDIPDEIKFQELLDLNVVE